MIGFIGFIVGLVLGGGIGVFATALCVAAGDADHYQSCYTGKAGNDFPAAWDEIRAETKGAENEE